MDRIKKLDMTRNQHLMSIRVDGQDMGSVFIKDEKIVTEGFIGYNTYENFVDLIYGLQGFGIAIDNFYY